MTAEFTAPEPRCGRRLPHVPHTYVVNPASDIDLQCPGVPRPGRTRPLPQLLAAVPALAEVRVPGVVLHQLAVMSA